MAITITKTKKKNEVLPLVEDAAVALDPAEMGLEELADMYGSLEDRCNALMADPVFTLFQEVKREFDERIANDYDPLDGLTVSGKHWLLEVGVAAKNPAKLKDAAMAAKMLGQEVFNKIAKVTLADLGKYLTGEQYDKVVDTKTGYSSRRKITCKFKG